MAEKAAAPQVDAGPGTVAGANAELFLGVPPTAGVEVHVPAGANPLPPSSAPFVEVGAGTYLDTGVSVTAIKGAINTTVAGIKFAIPA